MTTKIEWCEESWNPITGCSHAGSPGCDHCYAKRMANRLRGRYGYPKDDPFSVTFHPGRLNQPLKWKKPKRIFVCSMGDLFHEGVKNDWIRSVLFTMFGNGRHHTYIILTKRPERMLDFFMHHKPDYWPLPNVIGMVTAENQQWADKRIPILLQSPFASYGVSLEPLLGEIDLKLHDYSKSGCSHSVRRSFLNWVIVGGESGARARAMNPDWARSIRDQCQAAGVSFFMKQMSGRSAQGRHAIPDDLMIRGFPITNR